MRVISYEPRRVNKVDPLKNARKRPVEFRTPVARVAFSGVTCMDTLRVGVIGDPVAPSLSPVFQQAAFDELGIAALYERWHTPLADLPARIGTLRSADALG